MKRAILVLLALLLAAASPTGPDPARDLPKGFALDPENEFGGMGFARSVEERSTLKHYPIVFVPDHLCDPADWIGKESSRSACMPCDEIERFYEAGFEPIELWILRVMPEGAPWNSLEEHTDDLRHFVFSVLNYTGASKVQIVAHGAGAALALYAMKKYNLYNLVHAAVFLGGPMHGTSRCDMRRCLASDPVCCSLTPGSNFLREMLLPSETPYNLDAGRQTDFAGVKYLTLRNGRPGGDWWFPEDPDSPRLIDADNRILSGLDHDGLRRSKEAASIYIPFLSDETAACRPENDLDRDGHCDRAKGGNDCNDADPKVFPGATESCGDGIDQDCNGFDFSCATGRDVDP